MKKFTMLLIVAFLLVSVLGACNSAPTETDTSTTSPKLSNDDATASTEANTPSDTESNTTDPSKTQPLIPKDPEELVRIITEMGFKADISKVDSDEYAQDMADAMGISIDAREGLVFVYFGMPGYDEDELPDHLAFFYCTNVKRALEIKSVLDIESGYVIKQEGTIIAYGTENLWEAFIEFTSDKN